MTKIDLYQLETRVDELVTAYRRLQVENSTLTREFASLTRKNAETRQRLQAVIDRIKALEEEAEAQDA